MKAKMKTTLFIFYTLPSLLLLHGCNNGKGGYDATGNFEADEVIVSSEASGKILSFNIDEGQILQKGTVVGLVDTLQLHLRKKQLTYAIQAVLARQPDIVVQLATLKDQIATAQREKERFEKLLREDAATQKQVDDLDAQLSLYQRQHASSQSTLATTNQALKDETMPLKAQVEQLQDQIQKSVITNPIQGTVLVKYAEAHEVTAQGKALYKIADLSHLILRAYLSGDQLSQIKLGQKVAIQIDESQTGSKNYEGEILWVSDKAEFTPKTIQTKDERANLVYAIKIKVRNDGFLKIGMYGEVKF